MRDSSEEDVTALPCLLAPRRDASHEVGVNTRTCTRQPDTKHHIRCVGHLRPPALFGCTHLPSGRDVAPKSRSSFSLWIQEHGLDARDSDDETTPAGRSIYGGALQTSLRGAKVVDPGSMVR